MQTFLPYPDFVESARVLDYKRLGSQRKECAQLINTIETGVGWSAHPATHMWTGYVPALKLYMDACVTEWVRRGYRNNYELHFSPATDCSVNMPPWLGDPLFHASHRRALLYKSEYYDQFNWEEALVDDWNEPADQIYWWPRLTNTPPGYVLRKKGDY